MKKGKHKGKKINSSQKEEQNSNSNEMEILAEKMKIMQEENDKLKKRIQEIEQEKEREKEITLQQHENHNNLNTLNNLITLNSLNNLNTLIKSNKENLNEIKDDKNNSVIVINKKDLNNLKRIRNSKKKKCRSDKGVNNINNNINKDNDIKDNTFIQELKSGNHKIVKVVKNESVKPTKKSKPKYSKKEKDNSEGSYNGESDDICSYKSNSNYSNSFVSDCIYNPIDNDPTPRTNKLNKINAEEDKNSKWVIVPDASNFTNYLKLDDKHCPLPQYLPQDQFKNHSPYELFTEFFTDELLQHTVDATNDFMENYRKQGFFYLKQNKRNKQHYVNLTLNELRVFVGFKIYVNLFNCATKRGK